MEEKHPWAPVLGACILLVLFASLGLVAAGGWTWFAKFLESSAAGWVQALGGVVAIVFAYRMGRAQITADRVREDEKQIEEDLRRLNTIDALLCNGMALCNLFKKAWIRRDFLPVGDFKREYWLDARQALANVDPFQCPSTEVVLFLVQAPRQLDELVAAYDEFTAAFFRSDEGEPLYLGRKDLRTAIEDLEARLDATIVHLNDARAHCGVAAETIEARRS